MNKRAKLKAEMIATLIAAQVDSETTTEFYHSISDGDRWFVLESAAQVAEAILIEMGLEK